MRARKYRRENPKASRASVRKYQRTEKGKASSRRAYLKCEYGITSEEYERRLACQGGVCKLCGRPPKKRRLNIDHDHDTGRIRGLLCSPCNRALATLGDNVEGLKRTLEYLIG